MNVWAISDLHLSFARPDRRERFAERWRDHAARIERSWRETVGTDDLVLLPGDISMARNHRELQPDLDWIHRLPGTKIIAPGNHDQWWNGLEAVRPILRASIQPIEGNAIAVAGLVICGARGAAVLDDESSEGEILGVEREISCLSESLQEGVRMRESSETPLIVLWHFPPFDRLGHPGPVVDLMQRAKVTACIYGHLHTAAQWGRAIQGIVRDIRYFCVSSDAIGFRPLRIKVEEFRHSSSRRMR